MTSKEVKEFELALARELFVNVMKNLKPPAGVDPAEASMDAAAAFVNRAVENQLINEQQS